MNMRALRGRPEGGRGAELRGRARIHGVEQPAAPSATAAGCCGRSSASGARVRGRGRRRESRHRLGAALRARRRRSARGAVMARADGLGRDLRVHRRALASQLIGAPSTRCEARRVPPCEMIVGRRPQPGAARACVAPTCPSVRGDRERSSGRGSSGARNTRRRGGPRRASSRSSTTTPSPTPDWLERLAGRLRATRAVLGVGRRGRPGLGGRPPALVPEEFDWVVGCTYRGLPAERAPRAQPDRLQHVVPARGRSTRRRASPRGSGAWVRDAARLRGDRALHPRSSRGQRRAVDPLRPRGARPPPRAPRAGDARATSSPLPRRGPLQGRGRPPRGGRARPVEPSALRAAHAAGGRAARRGRVPRGDGAGLAPGGRDRARPRRHGGRVRLWLRGRGRARDDGGQRRRGHPQPPRPACATAWARCWRRRCAAELVVVVDDAPGGELTPGRRRRASRADAPVRYVAGPARAGSRPPTTAGSARSATPLVAFTDDDVVAERGLARAPGRARSTRTATWAASPGGSSPRELETARAGAARGLRGLRQGRRAAGVRPRREPPGRSAVPVRRGHARLGREHGVHARGARRDGRVRPGARRRDAWRAAATTWRRSSRCSSAATGSSTSRPRRPPPPRARLLALRRQVYGYGVGPDRLPHEMRARPPAAADRAAAAAAARAAAARAQPAVGEERPPPGRLPAAS